MALNIAQTQRRLVGGHDLRDVQSLILGLSELGTADVDGHGWSCCPGAMLPHDGDKPQGLKNWLAVTFDTLKCP